MNLLVLSNVNLTPLARHLPEHNIVWGDYGDVVPALSNPESPAHTESWDGVLVLLDADEALASGDLVEEVPALMAALAKARPDVLVVGATLWPNPLTVITYAAALDNHGPRARADSFNAALRELATDNANVAVFDIGLVWNQYGRAALRSPAFWYAGRIPYTTRWFEECGTYLNGLLRSFTGAPRKVLVCDLDNTLWGGVLGEDGPSGIALGEDGIGKCYRDLQHHIKELQATGVLLALVSKNEDAEVESVLINHPLMVLRPEDFVARRINWTDKVTNLRSIASELSLGLESFVFLDDNAVERSLVSEYLPEVAVPDFPLQPELLPDWFVRDVVFPNFARTKILASDQNKTPQYQARQQRKVAAIDSLDLDAFLASLNIVLDIKTDDEFLVERAAQMTQKTNQFNLTTKRCTTTEIASWRKDDGYAVVTLGYADRFGEEGVVGLAVLDRSTASIPIFLLSCRVIGRMVEHHLLDEVEQLARKSKLTKLECTFVPTERNNVAADFLRERGWEPTQVSNSIRYRKDLS